MPDGEGSKLAESDPSLSWEEISVQQERAVAHDSFLPRCIVKKDKNPDRAMWWNPTNGKLTSHWTASHDFWCVHRMVPTTLRASMTNGRQN